MLIPSLFVREGVCCQWLCVLLYTESTATSLKSVRPLVFAINLLSLANNSAPLNCIWLRDTFFKECSLFYLLWCKLICFYPQDIYIRSTLKFHGSVKFPINSSPSHFGKTIWTHKSKCALLLRPPQEEENPWTKRESVNFWTKLCSHMYTYLYILIFYFLKFVPFLLQSIYTQPCLGFFIPP